MYRYSSRLWPMGPLFTVLLSSSACGRTEDMLRRDDLNWLWFVTPLLAIGFIGAMVVLWMRKDQLERWDLAGMPDEPSVRNIELGLIAVAGVAFVVFVLYGFSVTAIDPRQQIFNVVLWLMGTTLGVLVSLFVGLSLADRLYRR